MYFGGGMPLDKKEADEENDVDTANVEAAFALLMRWLHRQPEFTPEMLEDEEVQQFIRTHAAVLDMPWTIPSANAPWMISASNA